MRVGILDFFDLKTNNLDFLNYFNFNLQINLFLTNYFILLNLDSDY
jgi:hypothetical protein